MRAIPVAVLAVCLVLAAAPASLGQEPSEDERQRQASTVTFYGHVFGHTMGSPMPANTEAPIGEDNYGIGSFHWCTGQGLPDECRGSSTPKLALFSTPGFVDVETRSQWQSEGTYELLHNERGQTKDVLLDTSESITARIFVTVDYHGWPVGGGETNCLLPHPPDVPCFYPYWGWDAGVQPDFVVEATLYSAQLGEHGANASDAPPIEQAWTSGDASVVAQGQWGPEMVVNGLPGSPNVNEFVIDLGPPQVDKVPKSHDFFLVYSFHSDTAGNTYGIHSWRIWAGEFFAPTFTLPVKNAFDVERVIPNFAHGKLAILGVMNTPWGSYDVDPESVGLAIEGPEGEVVPEHMARFGDFSVAHGGHYLPINLTWIWDYRSEDLRPGEYTVTVSASNYQGSARAACTATFELREAEGGVLQGEVLEEGLCGQQTLSQERLEALKEGASEDSGA